MFCSKYFFGLYLINVFVKKGNPPHFRMFQIQMHILGIWLSWLFQHFATTCHLATTNMSFRFLLLVARETHDPLGGGQLVPFSRWYSGGDLQPRLDEHEELYVPCPNKNLHLFKQQIKHKKLPTFAVPSFWTACFFLLLGRCSELLYRNGD